MIVTTTHSIEGKTILEYKGIAFGETINGVNLFKDMAASLRDAFGGRSRSYEKELRAARQNAIEEMCDDALQKGANAVVGVSIGYESLGEGGHGMLMVTASGTAVVVDLAANNQVQSAASEANCEPLTVDKSKEYIVCPVCLRYQKSDHVVCSQCGTALIDATKEKPTSVSIDRTKDLINCPVCGCSQKSNRYVCMHCGVKFEA